MVWFLSTCVETRQMAIKGNVYYLWQIYILHQFIPPVHHLLFLRMYSSYDYVRQNMYYVGLMYRGPVHPRFMGFKNSVLVSHRIEFGMPNVPGFLSSHVKLLNVWECAEILIFPQWEKNIYSSRTAIKQALTVRNRTGRGVSVDYLL